MYPSCCWVYTSLIKPFLVLKLKAMVSFSYVSDPILKIGVPNFVPVESVEPVACTRLESSVMYIWSLVRSIF